MFKRKNGLFQNVSLGLALGLLIFFSLPCTLPAEEKAGGIDDISLGEILNLEPSMVTATKRKISVRKAPAIATVITADEIRNMGARDLTDVLKTVPGFGVSINETGSYMFEVRGTKTPYSEKIVVMIDGHRLYDSYWGSALAHIFNDLSVGSVKQIEVIRGPGSALYGANAFVGVVNVITKDADDIDGAEATVGYGSFDTNKVAILGGKSSESMKVFGSFDHVKTNGPDLTIEADRFAGAPFSRAPGKTDQHQEKTEAFLKVASGDLTLRGQYSKKDQGAYLGFASALTENNRSTEYFWTELKYAKSFTDAVSGSLRTYYDYYAVENYLGIFPKGFPGYPDGMIGNPGLKNRTIGTELQFDLDLFKGNHLIVGLNFDQIDQYDVTHNANFNPFTYEPLGSMQDVSSWANHCKDATRKIWAGYVQDEWGIMENLNLTAGVRYDYYDDFGSTTNPRVGLVWNFLKDADLKLLYGQAFRAPNFVELYAVNNPVLHSNPDLKPETIRTYEAALGYRFAGSYMANVNYFHNDIKDQILYDYSTSPAVMKNLGGAKVDGVELALEGKYSPVNYWRLSYAWQNPKDADTDKELPYVPSQRASFSLNWGITKYLNAHTDVLWTGSRPRDSGDTRPDMSSYTTVDLSLIARNFYKNLEVRGIIHNLFDAKYEDPDTSGAQKFIPYDFPREGVSAMVEVGYKF